MNFERVVTAPSRFIEKKRHKLARLNMHGMAKWIIDLSYEKFADPEVKFKSFTVGRSPKVLDPTTYAAGIGIRAQELFGGTVHAGKLVYDHEASVVATDLNRQKQLARAPYTGGSPEDYAVSVVIRRATEEEMQDQLANQSGHLG